jgi:hypothetical protein
MVPLTLLYYRNSKEFQENWELPHWISDFQSVFGCVSRSDRRSVVTSQVVGLFSILKRLQRNKRLHLHSPLVFLGPPRSIVTIGIRVLGSIGCRDHEKLSMTPCVQHTATLHALHACPFARALKGLITVFEFKKSSICCFRGLLRFLSERPLLPPTHHIHTRHKLAELKLRRPCSSAAALHSSACPARLPHTRVAQMLSLAQKPDLPTQGKSKFQNPK